MTKLQKTMVFQVDSIILVPYISNTPVTNLKMSMFYDVSFWGILLHIPTNVSLKPRISEILNNDLIFLSNTKKQIECIFYIVSKSKCFYINHFMF